MCSHSARKVIQQNITATMNMLSLGTDIEIVEARLQNAIEIAEGLGLGEFQLPSTRKLLFTKASRLIREKIAGI